MNRTAGAGMVPVVVPVPSPAMASPLEILQVEARIRVTARLFVNRVLAAVPARTLNRGSSACAARSGARAVAF